MDILEVNCVTGEETLRPATAAEVAAVETQKADSAKRLSNEATAQTAKAAILAKLGITEEELKIALG